MRWLGYYFVACHVFDKCSRYREEQHAYCKKEYDTLFQTYPWFIGSRLRIMISLSSLKVQFSVQCYKTEWMEGVEVNRSALECWLYIHLPLWSSDLCLIENLLCPWLLISVMTDRWQKSRLSHSNWNVCATIICTFVCVWGPLKLILIIHSA